MYHAKSDQDNDNVVVYTIYVAIIKKNAICRYCNNIPQHEALLEMNQLLDWISLIISWFYNADVG